MAQGNVDVKASTGRAVRFVKAALTCIAIAVSNTSEAADKGRLPTSFWWYINADVKGWRYWSAADDKTWVETYENTVSMFSVERRITLYGCQGVLLLKDNKATEAFIPDSNCTSQVLMLRAFTADEGKARWVFMAYMQNTKYGEQPKKETRPPATVKQDPFPTMIDSIFKAAGNSSGGRSDKIIATIKLWALYDAVLSHCGIESGFLARAEASAKHCRQTDKLEQAKKLYIETRGLFKTNFDFVQWQCSAASTVISNGKQRLEDALTMIIKTCG